MSQPAKKLQQSFSQTVRTKPQHEYNWRVLIVEDEPAIAEGIQAILAPQANVIPIGRSSRQKAPMVDSTVGKAKHTKDQFEVVWAKNPAEALLYVKDSIAKNKPFAFGFFDVMLGADIDGIELVRQVYELDPEISAVFVTAYQDRTVDSIGTILGDDKSDRWDYINKPFTDGAILQKARNAVSMWNLKRQKKNQDEQLAEAANLLLQGERLNTVAAVGRSVAHEFGNLLMQIVGHAEIALLKGDILTMQKSLATILKAGDTASSIIQKFKKIQQPGQVSEFSLIQVNHTIDEALELMTHEFKKKSIKVTRPIFQKCEIDANHHSLMQVFVNLFINSTHAMNVSGQIDASVARIPDPYNDGEFLVEIKIRDHGPGIPQEILPKVVNPFFTTKGQQGTGLGLAICKDIIEDEHHGEMIIQNHPSNKGLEVIIRLPEKREVPGE